jgi:hypothetical protein
MRTRFKDRVLFTRGGGGGGGGAVASLWQRDRNHVDRGMAFTRARRKGTAKGQNFAKASYRGHRRLPSTIARDAVHVT